MEKKLNLHDVFGVLFPGAVLCACLYSFLIKRWFTITIDWSATLILLPVAYVVGILLHQFASKLFHEYKVASMLLLEENTKEPLTQTFTPEFKIEVKKAYRDLFNLPAEGNHNEPAQMYLLCNDYVLQQGKGIYVENHYAIYSLCRSMVLVSFLSGSAGIIGWLLSNGHAVHGFACLDFVVLFFIALFTVLAAGTFSFAKERFIRTLAIAVYRAFYSAYCDSKMPAPKGKVPSKNDD